MQHNAKRIWRKGDMFFNAGILLSKIQLDTEAQITHVTMAKWSSKKYLPHAYYRKSAFRNAVLQLEMFQTTI